MRKKCFIILTVMAMVILLSFSSVNAKELKVFPSEIAYDGFAGLDIKFNGFIGNSVALQSVSGKNLFFTIKKLPKQINISGSKFWILETNADEDWILVSDQSKKE